MSVMTWVKGRKTVATAVAVAVIAGVPLGFAVLHQGFPVTDVNLKPQNVWVTNGEKLLGGRLNHQIGELDAKVNGSSSKLDVLQDGGATLLADTSQGSVQVVDPAFVSLTDKITVPVGSSLSYGEDTLSILSESGKLWVLDTGQHLTFDATKTKPVASLGTDAQAVVTKTGMVYAVSTAQKKLVTIERPGAAASRTDFATPKTFQLSAVGDEPVVLDRTANTLLKKDGSAIALPAKGIRLQQPGPQSDTALVATGDGLLRVPLGGGDVETIAAGINQKITSAADVSAPVFLNGCAYGAWAAAQRYLYACDGQAPRAQDIGEPTTGADLVFRVNHGVIALNNLENGNAWVVSSNMRLVNNWAQVNPDEITKDGDTGKERPIKQSFTEAVANRTATNHVPIAVDDTFGARPERTTVLPVLDNDSDQDGDVLTITKVDSLDSAQGTVDVIEGGRALQYTAPAGDISSASFRYTISDGRQGFASAQVSVSIRPTSVNLPPVAKRTSVATVEVGQSIPYNALADWIDPDGDDIYLVGAAPTTPDLVQFTPDGRITFTSKTGQTGSKQVTFTVSDGRSTATGSLQVDVKPVDSLDPTAVPDFATGIVSAPIVVHPLDNDLSPSGAPLSLISAKLSTGSGVTVDVDQDKSTITLQTNVAGAYYVTYTVAAGAHSTEGIVLVNVSDPSVSEAPPIAVKDIVYVRPGEPSTVSVLDNDVSPSGRILVAQSVTPGPDATELNVEVLGNAVVRVTAPGVLADQVQLSYTVSDGERSATAGITVVPIPPLVNHQPPTAVDDSATVRAGDVATVHVLDNDYSPDNEPFTLDPTLVDATGAGAGAAAFVSGSTVRYQAPAAAGTYSVSYGVSDKFGGKATASVTFLVTAKADKNRAPEPTTLVARVFGGSKVDVVVPLDGIDPDGDSVSFDGIASAPVNGRVSKISPSGFSYEAYPNSAGTDTFTYTVRDTAGKTATGTATIGVVPRPSTVKPPVAVDDYIEVKPGKTASVPVLLNDSDPNGYTVSLVKKLGDVQAPLVARVSGANVLVTAPNMEGAFVVRYQITNGQGGQANAFVQVLVTKEAKPVYPVAADHIIDVQDLTDKNTVTVDALDGAQNPSGPVGDLGLAVKGENAGAAKVQQDDGKIVVTPTDHRLAITYSVTDPETKLIGEAFIIVPPKPGSKDDSARTAPPRIKPGLGQQIIKMNGTQTFTLEQILDVPSGRPAKLTGAGDTSATNSAGGSPYAGAQSLTFTGAKDYRGPAAITFKVNDGKDEGADADRVTLLTLPITIGNPDQTDVPPTFTPPTVQVEAGEKGQVVDLRASTFHPNPTVLSQASYRDFSGATKDVVADPSGSNLTVSAPLGTQPGATATIRFTVVSGEFTIPGSVNVKVVSSSRAKPVQKNSPQTDDFKRNTAGGKTFSNAVGDAYWINPFPEKPLVITAASVDSGPKGVTVSHTDNSITVSASTAASTGAVNVTYSVQDATNDKTRLVTGQLRMTIHDVPDAPAAPSNVKATDAQATMTIVAPNDNHGLTVTSYTVTATPGNSTKTVPSAGTVTMTGLTNGTDYQFSVVATNADGDSDPSGRSAVVTPYGTPSAPRSANLSNAGDRAPTTLNLSWSAPATTGGGSVEYSYKFTGDGWSGWQSGTTARKTNVGAGSYNFDVKVRNVGSGKESGTDTSNTVTVRDPDPPAKEVTLKADPQGQSGGTCSGNCHKYDVTLNSSFDDGGHTVTLYCNGNDGDYSFSGRHWLSSRYCGWGGTYVVVDGVKSNVVNFNF